MWYTIQQWADCTWQHHHFLRIIWNMVWNRCAKSKVLALALKNGTWHELWGARNNDNTWIRYWISCLLMFYNVQFAVSVVACILLYQSHPADGVLVVRWYPCTILCLSYLILPKWLLYFAMEHFKLYTYVYYFNEHLKPFPNTFSSQVFIRLFFHVIMESTRRWIANDEQRDISLWRKFYNGFHVCYFNLQC